MTLLTAALIGLAVGCAIVIAAGALFWKAHGRSLASKPDVLLTILGVLACGVLYLASLLLVPFLPVAAQDHAVSSSAWAFGMLGGAIAGGHVGLTASGGDGLLGAAKNLFTSSQPSSSTFAQLQQEKKP